MIMLNRCGIILILGCSLACKVGPDYARPRYLAPEHYKEVGNWKIAQPSDQLSRGAWWKIFADSQLDAWEARVNISNQNLAAAEAQYRQALAALEIARAGYFPSVTASLNAQRTRPNGLHSATIAAYGLPIVSSWEADLWGRIRRTVESSRASAQAAAAQMESVRLSVQAKLAQSYFQLRALDTQQELYGATIQDYQNILKIVQARYSAGVASRADVLQAQVQLENTQAQAIELGVQRAQVEHAMAVLAGEPASLTTVPRTEPLIEMPPEVPLGLPSELLERRPDIAVAERQMAAANAQIGVAKAAYFPRLTLQASGGTQSADFEQWLNLPAGVWSLGATLAQVVFAGGALRALTDQAVANYETAEATYRQTVLTAFQEVEDNLAALRILEQEYATQIRAVDNARQAVVITTHQYQAGTVGYFELMISQTTRLGSERAAANLLGRRMVATVLLIQALGGGWKAPDGQ